MRYLMRYLMRAIKKYIFSKFCFKVVIKVNDKNYKSGIIKLYYYARLGRE